MTDALPAPVVLSVLATLSVDLHAAVVLDADGSVLAGDAALAAAADALLEGCAPGVARQAPHPGGRVFAARSSAHVIAVVAGPHVLEALLVHDLLKALDDLRGC
jgi:hypothetical protein